MHLACAKCGTTFVDPLPTDEDLRQIYSWDNYHAHHFSAPTPQRFTRSLAFLSKHAGARRRVLDFGCGDGSFLLAARAGFTCEGVEYEATTIARARDNAGVPVWSLEELVRSGARFDVVHMNDVLPHLRDPVETLRQLEGLLSPDGLFFIEGPLENNASLVHFVTSLTKGLRRRMGLDSPAVRPPTMLMRLTRDGQKEWFREALGYQCVQFDVYETGWPYFVPGRSLRSVDDCVRQAVGALAILASSVEPPARRRLGNRYMAILAPRRRQ
jgi:SAM-dependent methyltransferase